MELTVQTEDLDGWVVATVHGDIDLTTAPRLREQVVEIVLSGRSRVVIDLNGVDFVDSTGLGVLVGLLKRARTHGGDVRLVSSRVSLLRVLELTSLDLALPPHDSVAAAIATERTEG